MKTLRKKTLDPLSRFSSWPPDYYYRYLGTIRPENSGAAQRKLHSETQVTGRLGMSEGSSPRHTQNPLLGEGRKTLSITHHALSPPPSHHHLYIIHLINWLQRFYRTRLSLKRPFVPKSDLKQWFTTTTTTPIVFCIVIEIIVMLWLKWFSGFSLAS